jgi:hypothetical protein
VYDRGISGPYLPDIQPGDWYEPIWGGAPRRWCPEPVCIHAQDCDCENCTEGDFSRGRHTYYRPPPKAGERW